MAAVKRDYYEVLGVPRDADAASIKRAFRRLARELHPDVSSADDGGERFKEIVEAYEVLSSAERRQIYDRYGHAGLQGGGFVPTTFDLGSLSDLFAAFFGDDLLGPRPRRSRRGADIVAQVSIDLVDAAGGTTESVPFEVAVSCETCGGTGAAPGSSPVVCSACRGAGQVQHVSRSSFAEFVRTQTCERCGGTGTVVESPCESCGGGGRRVEERALDVPIPPGIHDGQRIRISGEGHAGDLGGEAGDVYVLVHVRPDERFVREGNDIFAAVDVSVAEAALGTRLGVPTLDGDIDVEVPAGTQPGDVLTLPGLGMPVLQGNGRGAHRLLVNVRVPRRLTPEQRQALEQFAALEDARAYEDDGGLFERLKARFR